jgi:hypothetical protein
VLIVRTRSARTGACLPGSHRALQPGVALALHAAGHVVSIVNPAQIRDFARTGLGRNKSDAPSMPGIFANTARCYARSPGGRPRRLCDLQTMRAGFVASRVEWQNRAGSLGGEAAAQRPGGGDDRAFRRPDRGG